MVILLVKQVVNIASPPPFPHLKLGFYNYNILLFYFVLLTSC